VRSRILIALLLGIVPSFAAQPVHAIFRSIDQGRTWSRADRGLPGDARINAFGAVGGRVFAGTDSGIFVSDNQGQNWRPVAGATQRILAFGTLGSDVYAGSAKDGLFVSADQGLSWTAVAGFAPKTVRSLLVYGTRIYAGTDANGVLVSVNHGRSWTSLGDSLPAHAQIFAMAMLGERMFAGLYAKGLYEWNERDRRWTKAGVVTPLVLAAAGRTLIAGHNPGGLHYSEAPGNSWSHAAASLDLPADAPVWQLGGNNEISFAGAAKGIYYSEDRGRTWIRARQGLPAESPGVAFHVGRGFVLAATLIQP